MVIITTLITPPLLRLLLPPAARNEMSTLSAVITETMSDGQ
jgi:hypothetical protein